jgi:hypothetical protein
MAITKQIKGSMKPAVKRLIDQLPEQAVEELLYYLLKDSNQKTSLLPYLDIVLKEDKNLLKRLAN